MVGAWAWLFISAPCKIDHYYCGLELCNQTTFYLISSCFFTPLKANSISIYSLIEPLEICAEF